MNKLFQWNITSLLASGIVLSTSVLANPTISNRLEVTSPSLISDLATEKTPLLGKERSDSTTAPLLDKAVPNSDLNSTCYNGLCFTLQHRFNGGEPLPSETIELPDEQIEANPFVILKAIRDNFSKHLKTQKRPVQIQTELAFLLPNDVTQVLGKIPNVSINTNLQKEGNGTSHVVFPPYRREIPMQVGEGFVDWKGFDGQFTFTDQFKTLTAVLNLAGFKVKGENDFTTILGPTTLNATLGANGFPIQLDLNLPSFQSQKDQNNHFDLQNVLVNFNTNQTTSGIKVGHIKLNLGKVDFVDNETRAYLENLAITTSGVEQEGLFDYTLQTQVAKLRLPPALALGETLEVNYAGNISFRRLDIEALLALQTVIQQAQLDSSMMMPLLVQLMAVGPKLLAKSPEIILNQIVINTPKGNLQGHVKLTLDGQKVTELFDPQKWLAALQTQVALTMDKTFMEHALASQVYYLMLQYMGSSHNLSEENQKELQQQAKMVSQEQIQKFVQMKRLVETDKDRYQLDADFKDQKLIINGQETGLPKLPQ